MNLPFANMRVFISYSTNDNRWAGAVKKELSAFGFEAFLAHEDLQISEVWKERILDELRKCSIFVPILSKSFRESDYAPQEVGVIAVRPDVHVMPVSIDETVAYGFISQFQSHRLRDYDSIRTVVIASLAKGFPAEVIPEMIKKVVNAFSFRSAEAVMAPLVPLFDLIADRQLEVLVDGAINNEQVWSASLCRTDYLPKLIRLRSDAIPKDKLARLKFLLES